jgi:hypothetical protein
MSSHSQRPSSLLRRGARVSSGRPAAGAFRRTSSGLLAVLLAAALAGCGITTKRVSYDPEEFDSTTTHARSYVATEAQTCEAARRALLSQGYLISAANSDLVTGRKSFQPAAEVHVEVEFRVVCAHEGAVAGGAAASGGTARKGGTPPRAIAFVTALQDRYGIKKVNNSATVGVGVLGSLSLPFSSSDEAMVKIASETLTDERFYERFFALLDRFLARGMAAETPERPEPAADRALQPVAPPTPAMTSPIAPPVMPMVQPLDTPVPLSPERG